MSGANNKMKLAYSVEQLNTDFCLEATLFYKVILVSVTTYTMKCISTTN